MIKRPKGYSYLRYSSLKQSLGDSERRQVEAMAKWAGELCIELDGTLVVGQAMRPTKMVPGWGSSRPPSAGAPTPFAHDMFQALKRWAFGPGASRAVAEPRPIRSGVPIFMESSENSQML